MWLSVLARVTATTLTRPASTALLAFQCVREVTTQIDSQNSALLSVPMAPSPASTLNTAKQPALDPTMLTLSLDSALPHALPTYSSTKFQ